MTEASQRQGWLASKVALDRAQEGILAGVILLLILVLFFSETIVTGRILSPADAIFATPFFSGEAPPSFSQASNGLLFDQVYQFTPWRHLTYEALRAGRLPLWNQYSASGTPIVSTMQSAVFYPINLILLALPFEQTFVWSAVIRLWIAGLSTFLLARRYGLRVSSSLFAAISFMLSGFMIVWLGHPQTNVAIWLPSLILVGDLVIGSQSRRNTIQLTCLLALLVGIQFFGGHIETSADVLIAFGAYYLLRWFQVIWTRKSTLRAKLIKLILPSFSAIGLGSGFAAAQLLPFFEWLPLSAEIQMRTPASFRLLNPDFWHNLLTLPLFVFPDIFNNPTWNYPYFSFLPWGNYSENILYVGVFALVFASIALTSGWRSQAPIRIWVVMGLVSLGMAFQFPLFDWLNQIPGLALANPKRLTLVSSFAMCIVSGFGVEAVLELSSTGREKLLRLGAALSVLIAGLGVILALSTNIILPAIRGQLIEYGRHLVDVEYADRATHSQSIDYYYGQVNLMADGLQAAFKIDNLGMYAPAFLAFLGLLLFIWSIRRTSSASMAFKIILLVLITADLFSFGSRFNPSIAPANFYPPTPIVSQLAKDKGIYRVTALRQDLIPDAHIMFDLSDIRGLDFPTIWYEEYMNLDPSRIRWLPYGEIFSSLESPLLKVLNIKYVISSSLNTISGSEFLPASSEGDVYLAELRDPMPRGFMVYQTATASNDDQALKLLAADPAQVDRRVILSEVDRAPMLTTDEDSQGSRPVGQVTISGYESERSNWNVKTPIDGYLFTSDAYYPGWSAYLDGNPTTLYRANVAFRAVHIPAGEHAVEYRYEPKSVYAGILISALSLTIILALNILARMAFAEG